MESHRNRKRILIFSLLLSLRGSSLAITAIDINPSPKAGWSGKIALSLNGQSGNTTEEEYEVDGLIRHRHLNRVWLVLGNIGYGKTNSQRIEDNGLLHVRYVERNIVAPSFDLEGFAQNQYDETKDLRRRSLAGGGARWRYHHGEPEGAGLYTFLGLGAFFEDEKSESTLQDDQSTRVNFYGKLVWDRRHAPRPITLYSMVYLQPKIDDFNDARILGIMGLEVPLSARWIMNTSINIDHDSEPFDGIKETDVEYKFRFGYSFS